jgi:Ca2+-binding EF-hand superfamily protein
MQMAGPGGRPGPEQLRKWFQAIDKDGDGELTAVELQAALQLGNLNFSLATVAHIIRIHDKTGSGTITFEEFGKLHEFLTNVQQSFEFFDKDRSNSLNYEEISNALQHAGYKLDPPALRVIFNRFDPSRSGSLQLTEFLALTLFMRSATATFNAFDSNRVGSINVNFNQFLYCAAHCI